jgi:hypothetical protein
VFRKFRKESVIKPQESGATSKNFNIFPYMLYRVPLNGNFYRQYLLVLAFISDGESPVSSKGLPRWRHHMFKSAMPGSRTEDD